MTTSSPSQGITIYAEYLSKIRQVTIAASLAHPADATIRVRVTDQGQWISIGHQGQEVRAQLPASVNVSGSLAIPKAGVKDLSWRLPVISSEPNARHSSAEDQSLPWTSMDLTDGTRVSCRKCDNLIVTQGAISQWKDLPSENWAEMMEFWHCHKPHDEGHKEDESVTTKGYGANSSIDYTASTGYVDLVSLTFTRSDCRNLLYSETISDDAMVTGDLDQSPPSTSLRPLKAFCQTCKAEIGMYRTHTTSVSLYKWQITCGQPSPPKLPDSNECLAALLTSSISRSGSAKSVVLPSNLSVSESSETKALYLWVLNADVKYTSSMSDGKKSAMKVLYQEIDVEKANDMITSMKSDVQDIDFPSIAIGQALGSLKKSSLLLPQKEQRLNDWHVGLLSRWDSDAAK